jgi:DNA-binding transcriptional LysR family regulator
MEMQQVRYFIAVAKALNFTRAAEECNVSQPALTRAIKLLEDELGGELIRREGRLSHLTPLGNRMLPLLQQCYDSALTAKALAKSVNKGDIAALSIAVSRTLDLDLLVPVLREMYAGFPGIQLKLRRGAGETIAQMLKNGDIDLAVGGPLGESWDRLEAWPMFTESFDLFVSENHELAKHNAVGLDVELFAEERFLLHRGADLNEQEMERLGSAGIALHNAHEVDSCNDLEALVTAGFGIGVAPSNTLRSSPLRHLRHESLDLHRTVAVYTVAGRPRSREVSTLLNMLRGADWSAERALAS